MGVGPGGPATSQGYGYRWSIHCEAEHEQLRVKPVKLKKVLHASFCIQISIYTPKNACHLYNFFSVLRQSVPVAVLLVPPNVRPALGQRGDGRQNVLVLALVGLALEIAHAVHFAVALAGVGAVD